MAFTGLLFVKKSPKTDNQKMLQNMSRVQFADSFVPTHAHKNIAIDANSSKIWLRDASGFAKIIYLSEIVRFEKGADTFATTSEPYILVNTKDLDKPTFKIYFDAHRWAITDAQTVTSKADRDEWFARLNAAIHR